MPPPPKPRRHSSSAKTPTARDSSSAPSKKSLFPARSPEELAAAHATYGRGEKIQYKSAKDKKLRGNLKKIELRYRDAVAKAADAELLRPEAGPGFIETEGELERTWKLGQKEIVASVDVSSAQKGFELKLDFGPYAADYTRDGKMLLLGGRKGHVATMDWREGKLGTELQLGQTIRDVKWLHNNAFFAVAQKKYTYIYDAQGTEVHCLKKHIEVTNMEYLHYHFLLATIGNAGYLKYQDTSTGQLVVELRTKMGTPTAMTQNPSNAIMHVGHGNGQVTLWSPNMSTPLVKLLTNRGPIRAVAVDRGGYYMAVAGADARLNIFDIRNYKQVHSYFTPTPASTLEISDTGLMAVGWGPHVTVWKDALKTKQNSPYLSHLQESSAIVDTRFCPFDDILGVGHDGGFSSLIIPGAGEPNFDALEVNLYATKKERQEAEVRSLMEKLRSEMISIEHDYVGKLNPMAQREMDKDAAERAAEKHMDERLKREEKGRARGRNSTLRRLMRKQKGKNVVDFRTLKLQELKERRKRQKERGGVAEEAGPSGALARFGKKRR